MADILRDRQTDTASPTATQAADDWARANDPTKDADAEQAIIADLREALQTIVRNDKTVYDYAGEHATKRNGGRPAPGQRWRTPREIALRALEGLPAADSHSPVHPIWCPACGYNHTLPVAERTDAGSFTKACPRVGTSNPIYFGSPIYTGDR